MNRTVATTTNSTHRLDKNKIGSCLWQGAIILAISAAIWGAMVHQYSQIQTVGPGNWNTIPAKVVRNGHEINYAARLSKNRSERYLFSVDYIAAGRERHETIDTNLNQKELDAKIALYAPNTETKAYQNKRDDRVTLDPGSAYFWSGAGFWVLAFAQLVIIVDAIRRAFVILQEFRNGSALRQRLALQSQKSKRQTIQQ